MGILLFELFRNPLFMGILNKWETLVILFIDKLRKSINRVQGAALVAVRNHKNIFWIDKE